MSADTSPATILVGNTEIDSALVAALREPRERMALLRLEQVFVEFLQSETDGWIEAGGPYNSRVLWPSNRPVPVNSYPPTMRQTTFQRCILHRLADRFGIVREPGSLLETVGAIRLIKLPDSKIPSPLLQDLDVSAYTADEPKPVAATRKMKIMKRDNRNKSHHLKNKNGGGANKNDSATRRSLSDKEKAYAEARARIFQEENQPSEDATNGITQGLANLQTKPDASQKTTAQERTALYHQSSSLRSSTGSLSSVNSGSRNHNTNTTPTTNESTMERKAVYRNYAEEANDPDFRRGVVLVGYHGPAAVSPPSIVPQQQQQQPALQTAWPQLTPTNATTRTTAKPNRNSLTASAPAFVPDATKNAWRPSS